MGRAKPINVFSHWFHLVDELKTSPMDFYASVESAIGERAVPEHQLSRITCREGGVLSAKREYLRVRRREFVFDICGAPFGNGFFVSWWLGEIPSGLVGILTALSAIPVLGLLFALLLRAFVRPLTYYQVDTALMFQEAIRGAVLKVLDDLTKSNGLRAPTDLERKPILSDWFKR